MDGGTSLGDLIRCKNIQLAINQTRTYETFSSIGIILRPSFGVVSSQDGKIIVGIFGTVTAFAVGIRVGVDGLRSVGEMMPVLESPAAAAPSPS